MDLCTIVTQVVSAFQSVVDSFFGAFSFLGLTAPDLASLINPILGCTTT